MESNLLSPGRDESDAVSEVEEVSWEEFGGNDIDYSSQFFPQQTFQTYHEAVNWAKQTAIGIDFELTTASHKTGGKSKWILVKCARGIKNYRRKRDMDTDAILRRDTKTKYCGCKFQIKVLKIAELGGWVVNGIAGDRGQHCHQLTILTRGLEKKICGGSLWSTFQVSRLTRFTLLLACTKWGAQAYAQIEYGCDESVRANRIHPFWRSLAFEGLSDIPVTASVYADRSEDHRFFHSLVEKVEKLDHSMVRSISMMIHDQINPEQSGFKEPEVKDTVRGRPKGNSSTKRNPNAWKYSQAPRGRARSSGSRSSRSRGRSSSSSVHNNEMSANYIIMLFFQSYVVYLGKNSQGSNPSSSHDSYYELLSSCMKSKQKAREAIFYSYTSYINGFAATLEDEEVEEISRRAEVVSVFPNEMNELHTTRSWEFLGMEKNGRIPADSIWLKARFGEDVIIGNIDTGVWPESESFNDEGMGPIPSKWKGTCENSNGVKCNKKLIGARYFNKGFEAAIGEALDPSFNTAADTDGHGTHTLSTAGGRFVKGATFLGSANGTAKGGSPFARVASYKACWPLCFGDDQTSCTQTCTDADILAAFDAAIQDNVDILSISLGSRPRDYFNHATSIGSFLAVKNGIVVVCSAGNSGPVSGSASNVAPWILTVAASTMDRDFPSNVILGNKKQFMGLSFNTNTLPARKYYPLIYSMDAKSANASATAAKFCFRGSLEPRKVAGKIVYCVGDGFSDAEKSLEVAEAGGVGMILAYEDRSERIFPQPHSVPTSFVSGEDGLSILAYMYSTRSPKAYISGGTQVKEVVAPIMAPFSSRGPNAITPEILKPDITAPGVYILAAYSQVFPYNIISGTSMSCPHVAGIAALLKTIHPLWSPAAIKSAIMTTARTRSNIRQPIVADSLRKANPFNYGSGHIRPNQAADPGLVYDLTTKDYLNFLCSNGYNSTQMSAFVDDPSFNCPSKNTINLLNFNYPSITVPNLSPNLTLSLTRTLKNVGRAGLYTVRVDSPVGISVVVEPVTLKFKKNEEKSFKVTLKAMENIEIFSYVFGGICWSDGVHYVRSPIVVKMANT
ncbi:subtilisin-like protease SBT5.3 [Euphorbia lathyris]|uniref:subtilisin-like protease SBT5.3 n=1 Tax=Euphorbia lathyris TaxID=212925 RepID=UPI003313B3C9